MWNPCRESGQWNRILPQNHETIEPRPEGSFVGINMHPKMPWNSPRSLKPVGILEPEAASKGKEKKGEGKATPFYVLKKSL